MTSATYCRGISRLLIYSLPSVTLVRRRKFKPHPILYHHDKTHPHNLLPAVIEPLRSERIPLSHIRSVLMIFLLVFFTLPWITVRLKEFVSTAFQSVGIEDWEKYLILDSALVRPADVISVVGDSSKARQILNWSPTVSFESMVKKLVDFDLESIDAGDVKREWKPE